MVNSYEFNKNLRIKTDALLKILLYNESLHEIDEKKMVENVVSKYIGKPIIIKLKVERIINEIKKNYIYNPDTFMYTTLNGTLKLLLLEYDQVWLKNTINEYCNNIKRNFMSVIQKLEITDFEPDCEDDIINVKSTQYAKNKTKYTVNLTKNTCTCPDFIYRRRQCKHLTKLYNELSNTKLV